MKQQELEQKAKHMAEERRKYTLKIVEEETKRELGENKRSLDALNTDDENEDKKYEARKLLELKRIKSDRGDGGAESKN